MIFQTFQEYYIEPVSIIQIWKSIMEIHKVLLLKLTFEWKPQQMEANLAALYWSSKYTS